MASTYHIKWLPAARADIDRLYNFIAALNADAAFRAINVIIENIDLLKLQPQMGRPWEHDHSFREIIVPFGARAYIVRYKVFEDTVIIVRIWHSSELRP